MPDLTNIDLAGPARRLRVDTLSRLRWLAIAGQTAAVLFTRFGLGFALPLGWCLFVVGLSAFVNIFLRVRFPVSHRLNETPATVLLGYDLLQLSALLFLTGGLENPFSLLFLAPIMISAASLSPMRTFLLGSLVSVAATLLVRWHLALPWNPEGEFNIPLLYTTGVWLAVVLGVAFIGSYGSRVAEEARQLSDALAATELILAREQHLTQLDGLAAAAAHELGTPLATITLVIKELITLVGGSGAMVGTKEVRDDLALLEQEAKRCRSILGTIASLGDEKSGPMVEMTISHLLEEVVGPQREFGVEVHVDPRGDGPEPVSVRNAAVLYGLGNLVENAIDFAKRTVDVAATWTADLVAVTIRDDGPGFSSEILSRFGEPYVTSRGPGRRAKSEEGSGLGLGLFIAKTLLERSGATVVIANAGPGHGTGAVVTVTWPRSAFERERNRRATGAMSRRTPVLFMRVP